MVKPSVSPMTPNIVPMVRMSEGNPGSGDEQAIDETHGQPDAKAASNTEVNGQAIMPRNDSHRQAGSRNDRANGNVQFSGDHQQTHGKGNDPDLGSHVEPT